MDKVLKWNEQEANDINKKIEINGKVYDLKYKDFLLNKSPNDLRNIGINNISLACLKVNENMYSHLFLNGDEEDSWFEIVDADADDREIRFSDCIYCTFKDENDLISLFATCMEQ